MPSGVSPETSNARTRPAIWTASVGGPAEALIFTTAPFLALAPTFGLTDSTAFSGLAAIARLTCAFSPRSASFAVYSPAAFPA
jgi:hypothetical protein